MTDNVMLSHIKSEPLEDEADLSENRKTPEEFVEELEKQLANTLTIQELPTVAPAEIPPTTINVPCSTVKSTADHASNQDLSTISDLKSKLKKSVAYNEELVKNLAAMKAELNIMKEKYLTEKITLESITKAKWKCAEQDKKKNNEKEIASLKADYIKKEKALTQKIESLTSDVGRLETDLKQTLFKMVQLETDLGASRSSVRLLTDKLILAETALEESVQAKERYEQLYLTIKSQCAELQQQVDVFKHNEQYNKDKLCELQDKVEHVSLLSLELPALRSQHDVTKNKLIRAEAKILQLESEVMDHKKKALNVNIMNRKLQQAQDNQKNTESAMTILVQKLSNLEHVKEDSENLKSALTQYQEERRIASNKIKRLKRRLSRKTSAWDKLTLFLRKLEKKAARGDLLTRSDFDAVVHFVLNSPFTDMKADDSSHNCTLDETRDEIDDDVTEIESSPVKDTIEKVVKKFRAVEITAKTYPKTSRSPSKSTEGSRHNERVLCSKKTTNVRTTRSNVTCSRGSFLRSSSRNRRSESTSPIRSSTKKRRSVSSMRRSHSRSLSVETISRSPSPLRDYKRCRHQRSRSRSYTKCSKSRRRYSPLYYSSRSSSREPSSSRRSFSKKNSKETSYRRQSSVKKTKSMSNDKRDYDSAKPRDQPETILNCHALEMEKVAVNDEIEQNSSPELTVLDAEENHQEADASSLEEGEIEKCVLSPVPEVPSITEAEWNALILSPKDSLGVENLSPALAQGSLPHSHNTQDDTSSGDQLNIPFILEIQDSEPSQDSHEVFHPSSSNICTMTHCTSEPSTSRQSPEIVPLCVVPVADVSESEASTQPCMRPALLPTPSSDFVPLVPPPRPPPFLALGLTNVPVVFSSNIENYVPGIKGMCNAFENGVAEEYRPEMQIRCRSKYSQQAPLVQTPPSEDWDEEIGHYAFNGRNQAPSTTWNKHHSRASYNNVNNLRIVVPPRRPYRPKNRRKFAPYDRAVRAPSANIPVELNIQSNVPQQPLPGHSIVDEFLQQYTVSIIKEIPGYSEKEPIEALKDLCISKGWQEPTYTYHADTSNNPRTLEYFCKVFVNHVLHQPKYGSTVKKDAQTIAAIYCLQQLGVNP